MKSIYLKFIVFLTMFVCSCNSNADTKPVNEDSIINALNAADTIPKIPQKVTDSINKAYLDSFSKHVDTNNAEYGTGH